MLLYWPPLLSPATLLAAVLTSSAPDLLAEDVSGQWNLVEARAGNKCTGTLSLVGDGKSPSSQAVLGTQRGYASYSGPCVDSATGTWTAQDGAQTGPRLAARLAYVKSTVFYSLALDRANDGTLKGSGEIYAAPKSDPNTLRKVGLFDAQRTRPPSTARAESQ